MNMRDKNRWYLSTLIFISMLLVNPLFEWGGLPRPLREPSEGSNFGKMFVFMTSSWGIQYALNGMLEISLGKIFPKLIYQSSSA